MADLVGVAAEAPLEDGCRAAAVLEGLSRLVPFDCAVLCRIDASSLSAVAASGYGRPVGPVVARAEYREEQRDLGMDASRTALRFADLPAGGRRSFTVTELAWPAGLHDGMGMTVRSPEGHVVGHIALNAARTGVFNEEHRDLLGLLHAPLSAALGARGRSRRSAGFALTARELEVLELISLGCTNRQIAEALVVSSSTVRRHVEHVLAKLEVRSRTAAAMKASRHGLLGS